MFFQLFLEQIAFKYVAVINLDKGHVFATFFGVDSLQICVERNLDTCNVFPTCKNFVWVQPDKVY
jgi:hypothetical protein